MPQPSKALPTWAQLADKSGDLALAFAQSGAIRENNGSNRSDLLDKYESVWGIQGASYCELLAMICRLKALCYLVWAGQTIDVAQLRRAKTLHEQQYGPCPVSCTETIAVYGKRKRWRPILGAQTMKWIGQLKKGDGIIYDFSTPKNFDRHFETFLKMQTNADGSLYKDANGFYVLITVGANTVPDAQSGSQSDGQGCYVRHRPINKTVLGSVDFNTQNP